MIKWSKKKALSFVLEQQFPNVPKGKAGVLEVIEHLGYVQMDTISVIERAHHHVLWSRVSNYEEQHLKSLIEQDKKVYDYWAHAASFLPMRDFEYGLYAKQLRSEGSGYWYARDRRVMEAVLKKLSHFAEFNAVSF